MKLRTPLDRVPEPLVCRTCGHHITALLRTEVDRAAGTVTIDARCPAGHHHTESRPLPALRPAPPPA